MKRGALRVVLAGFVNFGRRAQLASGRTSYLMQRALSDKTGTALLKRKSFANPTAKSSVIRGMSADKERVRRALETGGIYPVFQPIVRLPSGSIASFEVLARWYDDELGAVPCEALRPARGCTAWRTWSCAASAPSTWSKSCVEPG